MLLSAVSVLVVAQASSEIPDGLRNNPVYKGNNLSKRGAGHHRHNREEKSAMV